MEVPESQKQQLVRYEVVMEALELLSKYKDRCQDIDEFLVQSLPRMPTKEGVDDWDDTHTFAGRLLHLFLDKEYFMGCVVDDFYKCGNRRYTYDSESLKMMTFLILFSLNEFSYEDLKNTLLCVHAVNAFQLLCYLNAEGICENIKKIGSHVFDFLYLEEHVIKALKNSLVKRLKDDIKQYLLDKEESKMRHLTIPVDQWVLQHPVRFMPQPPSIDQQQQPAGMPPAKEPPISTYVGPPSSSYLAPRKGRKMDKQKQQAVAPVPPPPPAQPSRMPRGAPLPDFSKVAFPVKATATTVLREGARLMRDEQKEMDRLQALLTGGSNYMEYERLEADMREREEQDQLEAVERKHLLGLLSREEAALAKQALLQHRKDRVQAFRQEREMWERQLEEARAIEEKKIRDVVEKCHLIEQRARDKQREMQQLKRENVQEMTRETKALLNQALRQKQEELARKLDLIRELRALQQLSRLRVKEVDLTATSGLGLMCEMSIAELRERLNLMRTEVFEELQQRRAKVNEVRCQQQRLVADTQEYIRQQRAVRKLQDKAMMPQKSRAESQELKELRKRLQEARVQRAGLETDYN